jgi:hypothetical protein
MVGDRKRQQEKIDQYNNLPWTGFLYRRGKKKAINKYINKMVPRGLV